MTDPITQFDRAYRFLSNFHPSPIMVDGQLWPTVEHLFQAEKTTDELEREEIRCAATPTKAKHLGRKVSLRADWERIKGQAMEDFVRLKFTQHPHLAALLRNTGDAELIEGNAWHDNEWGSCFCPRCSDRPGHNRLGQILMKVRAELRAGARATESPP
jgi:hypothetical protein